MPNIHTRLGRYCSVCKYTHEDEYSVCDFCNEHKDSVYYHDRYYNYGFSKCVYCACNECHDTLFGPFRLVDIITMGRAYESILEVINERTDDNKNKQGNDKTIEYYEATRIAYIDREYLRKFVDWELNPGEINKCFIPLWGFTYKIVSGEEKSRVRVVNKDPDNLLVQWVHGGKTMTEIVEELRIKPLRS
jgi:hypothetical protein